jgi:hypothetical protein
MIAKGDSITRPVCLDPNGELADNHCPAVARKDVLDVELNGFGQAA